MCKQLNSANEKLYDKAMKKIDAYNVLFAKVQAIKGKNLPPEQRNDNELCAMIK